MSEPKPAPNAKALTRIFETVEFRDAYRISYLANAIVIPTYDEIRRRFGLIRGEYLLILCLAHFPVLTARDVARMSRRPRSSISRAVARMLAENYIERVPDPNDGRQAHLTITAEGRALHERIAAFFIAREDEVLGGLDADEREMLDRLLGKLTRRAASLPI